MELTLSLYGQEPPIELDFELSLDPESSIEIDEIIEKAEALEPIKDDEGLSKWIGLCGTIKSLLNGIEVSRESLKRPFLTAGQKIDGFARKQRSELEAVYQSLCRVIADFEALRHKERLAEKQRLGKEAYGLAQTAFAEENTESRDDLLAQAQQKQLEARAVTAPVAGLRIADHFEFEIEDIFQVLKFDADLLKIEINKSRCLELVRQLRAVGAREIKIPGIRVIQTMQASVKAK